MTGTKKIPISHVYYTDEIKSEELLLEKTLSHIWSTYKDESKIIIVDENST